MTSADKSVRVFISSTFRDMHGERDHLVTVVFPALRERLEPLGLDFFDVDLRWGIPQTGVDGEQANSWEYCRQWIDRVEPFFVSLLGERYGWMPESEAIRDAAEREIYRDLSITEMEIRHAVMGSHLRRHSYFYLRSTRVPTEAAPEVYQEFVDAAEPARSRLDALKANIETSGQVVRHYDCRWTGQQFVSLEAFGQMVLKDLWSGILREERFVPKSVWRQVLGSEPDTDVRYTNRAVPIPEELWEHIVALAKPEASNPLDQEHEQMASFAASRLKWFRGRRSELDRLNKFVNHDLAAGAAGLCVVKARPGQGKSALLARFADTMAESPHWVLTHFVGATERSADAHELVDRLNQELDRSGIEWPSEEDANPDPRRRLASRLAQHAGRKIVLIIDAVNQLTSGLDLEWLPSVLGPGVRVILSCIDDAGCPKDSAEARVLSTLRSRIPEVEWIDVGPLEEIEVRSIVTEYLLEYCKQLDRAQIDIICGLEQARNPLYLLVMLGELRTLGGNDMHRIVPTLIANLRRERPDNVSLFDWVLQRLEVFGENAVRLFCSYLAMGRVGMSSRELRDLVASQLGEEGARAAMRIERALRRYLLKRGPYLDFFHGEMRHAVERRYLAAAERPVYHQHIARYLACRGIEDAHALSELAWHLRQGGMNNDLFALVENADFQRKKLGARGAVHDVCADLGLAFDAASEADDTVRVAQFGFLHSGYSEGRFSRLDVIELSRRDSRAGQEEVKLYSGLARFRLLLLLALAEAEAGQSGRAGELVTRATAMRGLKLPEQQAPFVADAVVRLMKAGCDGAPALLQCSLSSDAATRHAVGHLPLLDEHQRVLFLNSTIEWMRQEFQNPSGTPPTVAFRDVANAAAKIKDGTARDVLIASLSGIIEEVHTALDVAVDNQDTLAGLMVLLTQTFDSRSGGGSAAKSIAQQSSDIQIVLRASLGAAMASNSLDQQGLLLLERAVEGCAATGVSSHCFSCVATELRCHHSAPSTRLLLRLISLARGDRFDDLKAVLQVLADDPGGEGLLEAADEVGNRIKPLPLRKRALLLPNLAIAYGNAGKKELARQSARHLHVPLAQLSLIALNPLIRPDKKLGLVCDTVRLVALTGERDSEWTAAWINRIASWTMKVQPEKDRVRSLKDLLDLIRHSGLARCVPAVLEAALAIKDEALCAEALEATITAAQALDRDMRATVRQRGLDRADRFAVESARLRVYTAWITFAGEAEASDLDPIRRRIDGFVDAAHRALALGTLASACVRFQRFDDARLWWSHAAYLDQEAEVSAMHFAARTAAAVRGDNSAAWEETLECCGCPDPSYVVRIVEIVAQSCCDPKRLEQLESALRRRQWHPLDRVSVVMMHLAVARAWGRLGNPERGGRLALHTLSRIHKTSLEQPTFREFAVSGLQLSGAQSGRRLLLQLIPRLYEMPETGYECAIDLAESLEKIEDDAFARTAFSQIYKAILEREYISPWRRLELLAGLAACLARRGQPDAATEILRRTPAPGDGFPNESEGNLLAPASATIAWARIGVAYAESTLRPPGSQRCRSRVRHLRRRSRLRPARGSRWMQSRHAAQH